MKLTSTLWMAVRGDLQQAPIVTLIAQYWLVPGTDSSIIYISRIVWLHNQIKTIEYKLN